MRRTYCFSGRVIPLLIVVDKLSGMLECLQKEGLDDGHTVRFRRSLLLALAPEQHIVNMLLRL